MQRKIKVFFGCSIRGGHGIVSQNDLAKIPDIIEELGHEVVSRHQTQEGIVKREDELATPDIHDRDYTWLSNADLGIFEISNPSLGVGGEISDILHLGKPVLCLFYGDEKLVSAYIRGKEGSKFVKTVFICRCYSTIEEAKNIITQFIEENF